LSDVVSDILSIDEVMKAEGIIDDVSSLVCHHHKHGDSQSKVVGGTINDQIVGTLQVYAKFVNGNMFSTNPGLNPIPVL
jgi:hypothetical protein